MITTLTGKNSYLLRRRLAELQSAFRQKYGDLAVERIESEEAEIATITEAVQALPFLAERKMVIIRDFSLNPAAGDQIEHIIDSISETTDVIFQEATINRRGTVFKLLKAKTKLEDFSDLEGSELAKWLAAEAKKEKGELSFGDANYLIERVGADQASLANELDKLLTYQPKIDRESIDLLTEPTPQSRIFDLLDAAFKQDKQRALKLYEEQRAQKVEPQAILAMLAWQLRLLAIAQNRGNRSASEVAKDFSVSEYPLRKAADLAAQFDKAKLKELVHDALEIDIKSKTSALDLDEALKTYIATI